MLESCFSFPVDSIPFPSIKHPQTSMRSYFLLQEVKWRFRLSSDGSVHLQGPSLLDHDSSKHNNVEISARIHAKSTDTMRPLISAMPQE